MKHDFDTFVKEHLQEMLCQAEKEQSLVVIRKIQAHRHGKVQTKRTRFTSLAPLPLQDCAISPSFSQSRL